MGIRIENLNKAYGGQQVLKDFCAEFPEGKVTCIMAPSGRGKTTLFRILLGLEKADSGKITGLEEKRISAVFQENRLCENLSAGDNIRLVQTKKEGRTKDFSRRIEEGLRAVGLEGCSGRPVREFSGGMKRRIALLRALYAPCEVLLLDEPFKGLDKETKVKVMDFVRDICQGKTVLCITHEEEEVQALEAGKLEL